MALGRHYYRTTREQDRDAAAQRLCRRMDTSRARIDRARGILEGKASPDIRPLSDPPSAPGRQMEPPCNRDSANRPAPPPVRPSPSGEAADEEEEPPFPDARRKNRHSCGE